MFIKSDKTNEYLLASAQVGYYCILNANQNNINIKNPIQ